ncbi:MAG: siderophore-interacting protein [Rhodobacteraceae bacterium]|nr:siderophore-interacting protein [Paracoccaceae bacterium]
MQVQGEAINLTLRAANDVRLHALKQVVFARLARLEQPVVPAWDHVAVGALPPNLTLAQVASVTRISPHFTRVRVEGHGLERFGDGGLHFRLLLARPGQAPVWPRIAADGRTVWPEGKDTLHRPVYTTRAFDPAGKWLDFDVFLHAGGRVTEWTSSAGPGDPVGLMGPSGSDTPQASWVGLFGDETALPAIACILAALDRKTRGDAFLQLSDLSDVQDLPHPPGVAVHWLTRGGGNDLVTALRGMALPETDRFVWFASEASEASAARSYLRDERGFGRAESNISGFWTAETSGHA